MIYHLTFHLFFIHPTPLLPLSQATPKDTLVLAVEAMELHFDLWQRYFDDFLQHKLRLGGLRRGAISQQVLNVIFEQLHKQEAISRVVSLHCYIYVFHPDFAKVANLLRPLNQMQQVGGMRKEQIKLVGYRAIAMIIKIE